MKMQPMSRLADSMSFDPNTAMPPADGLGVDATPQACARLVRVVAGLHVLSIGPIDANADDDAAVALPAIQVTSPPSNRFDPVEIITEWNDSGAWLGAGGGVVVLRSPPGGGQVLITGYAEAGTAATLPDDIALRPINGAERASRLDSHRADLTTTAPPSRDRPPTGDELGTDHVEVETEVMLHIERQGDRRFPGRGWVGNRGQQLQVEAISISPRGRLSDADIEYKAFGPGGRETRWVSDAMPCGTRGRGLPLTGFAVRLAPRLRDRFDVIYQGSFFKSGATELRRNGEPCLPAQHDDVLEAINLRVVERADQ
jgi:hypothetical protein